MQLLSWFGQNSSSSVLGFGGRQSKIIAQIFFPTDTTRLDVHDRLVVSMLATYLKECLKRERVELAIIGHADHRGKAEYNKSLGWDRARTVARELYRLLYSEPLFSFITCLSEGERHATQETRNPSVLAEDRRVDVWDTSGYIATFPAAGQDAPVP